MTLTLKPYLAHLQSKGIKYSEQIVRGNRSKVDFNIGKKMVNLIFDELGRIKVRDVTRAKNKYTLQSSKYYEYQGKDIVVITSETYKNRDMTTKASTEIIHKDDGKAGYACKTKYYVGECKKIINSKFCYPEENRAPSL